MTNSNSKKETKTTKVVEPAPEVTPNTPDTPENNPDETPEDEDKEIGAMIDEAKRIFKMHPGAQELHFATDGTAFFEPYPAKAYAGKLQDREVTVIKRKSLKF